MLSLHPSFFVCTNLCIPYNVQAGFLPAIDFHTKKKEKNRKSKVQNVGHSIQTTSKVRVWVVVSYYLKLNYFLTKFTSQLMLSQRLSRPLKYHLFTTEESELDS